MDALAKETSGQDLQGGDGSFTLKIMKEGLGNGKRGELHLISGGRL